MEIKPKCNMLIDQDRYIGNVPVGYCCFNDAEYETGGYFFCSKCFEMLLKEPERITFGLPTVHNWRKKTEEQVKAILDETGRKIKWNALGIDDVEVAYIKFKLKRNS